MEGLTMIMSKKSYKEASFIFEATTDVVLFIGIKAEDKAIIPKSFNLIPLTVAVLEIAADAQPNQRGEIVADKDYKYFIFEKEFKKGRIEVPFEWNSNIKESSLFFFIKLDGRANV